MKAWFVERPHAHQHEPAEAATVGSAVAAGRELHTAHEVRMNDRAHAAFVIEHGNADAVDVDTRVLGSCAPDDELGGAHSGASDTGEILHDLEHITLRAWDTPALIRGHLGGHDLLVEPGRYHDQLQVIVVLGLLLRRLWSTW